MRPGSIHPISMQPVNKSVGWRILERTSGRPEFWTRDAKDRQSNSSPPRRDPSRTCTFLARTHNEFARRARGRGSVAGQNCLTYS
jgi:hypothetical protein